MKYLPKWFPFTTFHQIGDYGNQIVLEFVNKPFAYVQRAIVSVFDTSYIRYTVIANKGRQALGNAPESFVSDIMTDPETVSKNGKHSEDFLEDIKWAAGTMFSGICFLSLSCKHNNPNYFSQL